MEKKNNLKNNLQTLQRIEKNFLKKKIKLIIIDGITCSGKTLFSKLLFNFLKKKYKVKLISKDLFLAPRNKRIKVLSNLKKQSYYNQNFLHYDHNKISKIINCFSKNNKIILKNLYYRKTGQNTKTTKFDFTKTDIIIYEGIYILDDLMNTKLKSHNILVSQNVYKSLFHKIKRIRDKKISIQKLITEFNRIHLPSFSSYLRRQRFQTCLSGDNGLFFFNKSGQKKQISDIDIFYKKHI